MGTDEFTAGGNPAMDKHPIQGGVEILRVASCYGNRDKLRPDAWATRRVYRLYPFINLEPKKVLLSGGAYHCSPL